MYVVGVVDHNALLDYESYAQRTAWNAPEKIIIINWILVANTLQDMNFNRI